MLDVTPLADSTRLRISGLAAVGDLLLWLPEGVATERGFSSMYPVGGEWQREGKVLHQSVSGSAILGPGNWEMVAPGVAECVGVRFPIDEPVAWEAWLEPEEGGFGFGLRLRNDGALALRKVGAAICLRFLQAGLWSDESTFIFSGGRVRSLAEIGRDAGRPNSFQAYLVREQSFDNPFYEGFWGFNSARLDRPVMVSENRKAGVCLGVEAERAYFLHSNAANPCTDIMLAFGDLAPGQTAASEGRVCLRDGRAADALASPPTLA